MKKQVPGQVSVGGRSHALSETLLEFLERRRLGTELPQPVQGAGNDAADHATYDPINGPQYDVVIAGSGYGGSVAAYALAAAAADAEKHPSLRVLLLERGREFFPGDFPASFGELPRETRIAHQETGQVSGHEGLFDIRLGPDVVAMVANGLGGGSLINAGVMLEPEPDDIAHALLPQHGHTLLAHLRNMKAAETFKRATRLLGGQVQRNGQWVHNDLSSLPPAPGQHWPLRKAHALHELAAGRGTTTAPMDITVAWVEGANHAGTHMAACNQCGDCMTGCNVGAKNSLDQSLLAKAKALLGDRLTIVTGATVGSVVLDDTKKPPPDDTVKETNAARAARRGWKLRLYHTDARLQARETGLAGPVPRALPSYTLYVRAKHVVLAAGTFGSPEILMRSRTDELPLSPLLGESFSGNGDDIAAIHRLPTPVHGGADERVPANQRGVGPTTTTRVTLQGKKCRPFQVEEFAVPAPVKRLFDEMVTTGWALGQMPKGDWKRHHKDDLDPLAVNPQAMQRTLLVGVVGHDSADGSLRLAQPLRPIDEAPQLGALRIHWPQAREEGTEFDQAHLELQRFVQTPHRLIPPREPVLVANPMWRLLPDGLADLVSQPRGPVLTVHPLGGCRVGASISEGVVNLTGQVFDASASSGAAENAVFDNLVVLDGSIIGTSLGVNPALTIATLALHAMDQHVPAWLGVAASDNPETIPTVEALPGASHLVASSPCNPAPDDAPALPSNTLLSVTERLWGEVPLRNAKGETRHMVLELTLAFEAQPVSTLIGPKREDMPLLPPSSRLRLYDDTAWKRLDLKAASDEERRPFVQFEASLKGNMRFLHRAPSCAGVRTGRGLWAWLRNRGWRDIWQRCHEPLRHDEKRKGWALKDLKEFTALGSRNGQRRLFEYRLQIAELLQPNSAWNPVLPAGGQLQGHKELGYARRTSPWTQLTEMQLQHMPALIGAAPHTLKLDPRYLAQQGKPLLHIEQQRNHADALADLMCFGLYITRVLIDTHLWSFRRPDRTEPREPYRLPSGIDGLPAPEITTLVVDRWRVDDEAAYEPVSIRLTRYKPPKPSADTPPQDANTVPPQPLVMLHGYSASGTTFTHASLGADAAAAVFARAGRDVWVVDLRTSCGLASAARPWAMEEPALVDIPAALLHIRNVTGQKVDVLAHCIGGVMLGMALLSDAAWVRSGRLELGTDTWLTSEQLGTLTAFNGNASAAPGQAVVHPTVRRVVLSQKGPVLRYTDANVLRAYILGFARRWLLPTHFSLQTSRDPRVAEQLLDRFLSSLPYPRADFDVENPLWPCARTEWVASRHRLDALFGRVFTAANLRPSTLKAIDDLFGPINLDTVAQTIHFARYDTITNQRGRGEFVTQDRLRQRWGGIPTMVVQAQDSGMVDPYTHRLLTEQLQAAGVPVHRCDPLPETGHQDTLIGVGARAVLDKMRAFFDLPDASLSAAAAVPAPQAHQEWVCTEPWIGPRLHARVGGVTLAAMSRPDQGPCTLWLVPVVRQAAGTAPALFRALEANAFPWLPAPATSPRDRESGTWQFRALSQADLDRVGSAAAGGEQAGWLAVLVYASGDTNARTVRAAPAGPVAPAGPAEPDAQGGPGNAGQNQARAIDRKAAAVPPAPLPELPAVNLPALGTSDLATAPPSSLQPLAPDLLAPDPVRPAHPAARGPDAQKQPDPATEAAEIAVRQWLQAQPGATVLEGCFVPVLHLAHAARLLQDPVQAGEGPVDGAPGFRFALASCQYPYGLFDRKPAAASLLALSGEAVHMALMVGDQIYADASAGLVDPTRPDELYDQPHERAFRQPGMRAVMRRMPVFMLLDDHELLDNWCPVPDELPSSQRRVRRLRKRVADARNNGVKAYMLYQRMQDRSSTGSGNTSRAAKPAQIDLPFIAGGFPFYMLDTRSGRKRKPPSAGTQFDTLVDNHRMQALESWLQQHAGDVKFVVTPSMFLPRDKQVVGAAANAARVDAWDAFPASMGRLLKFIANNNIRRTVFLSGDAHHSLATQAWVGQAAIKLVSVHSSGLYAPYPFANGRPADLQLTERGHELGVKLRSCTQLAPAGDGYAVLQVVGTETAPALRINFVKADGGWGPSQIISLD